MVELQRLIFGRIRNSAIRVSIDQRVIKDGPEAIHGTSDESDASNLLIHEKS